MLYALALTVQSTLALVLAVSAASKWRNLEAFAEIVRNYRILPRWAVGPMAWILPLLETAAALGLLVPSVRPTATLLAVGLLLLFGFAIAINLGRGRTGIDCGCYLSARTNGIAPWMVVRNLLLALALMAASLPTAPETFGFGATLPALCAAVVFACLYHALPILLIGRDEGLRVRTSPAGDPGRVARWMH